MSLVKRFLNVDRSVFWLLDFFHSAGVDFTHRKKKVEIQMLCKFIVFAAFVLSLNVMCENVMQVVRM